jgi:hypothetical protein
MLGALSAEAAGPPAVLPRKAIDDIGSVLTLLPALPPARASGDGDSATPM